MTSRQRWVKETREATGRALAREAVPMSARALYGNLDIDTWTHWGPLTRSEHEISAALRWLVSEGYATRMEESDRWVEYDPPGVCYTVTEAGQRRFLSEVNR